VDERIDEINHFSMHLHNGISTACMPNSTIAIKAPRASAF
jgi:hypothetical protein